ncbi:ShlB/FhaC/HecB family hemolysin secretion/activation protein [Neisseriaceae bacterium TC5R-5]|nr:ShlB/FhaC/HecB family hemolysin secretion/activation protein [Neisseriaceae bacterium TC5R-5]
MIRFYPSLLMFPSTRAGLLCLTVLASCIANLGLAATVPPEQRPDVGQVLRDIGNSRPQLQAAPALDLEVPAKPTPAPQAPATDGQNGVRVQGFKLSGTSVFSEAVLLALLQDLHGRTLSLAQLQEATQRISLYYQQHGYVLSRAYLPAQEIDDGIVHIAVLEARYGQIEIENHSRLSDASMQRLLGRLEPGTVIEANRLQQTLLLLNDVAGIQPKSVLRAGTQAGTSDLLVQAASKPLLSGSVDIDNYGGKYTGKNRLNTALAVSSPLGLGDELQLRGLLSDYRQNYYLLSYELPVNRWFTRVGASYSKMAYQLGKDFADLGAEGSARTTSAHITQPLLRSRTLTINAQLQFDDKQLKDDISYFSSNNHKHSRLWTASLSGNGQDGWGGGGLSYGTLSYSSGDLNISDYSTYLSDSRTARTQGSFSKVNLTALRLQALTPKLSLYTQLSAQWASKNLDSSEKFSLGGVYGVRAYASGEASGDQGWLANMELRYALAQAWQWKAFVDHGEVKTNLQPWTNEANTQRRSAVGSGLSWYGDQRQVVLQLAWRLHHPDESGGNLESQPRLWVQATQRF